MTRRYNSKFTARETSIVRLILAKKEAKVRTLALDEILEQLGKDGELPKSHVRNSVLVCANGVVRKLVRQGIHIEKSKRRGAGNKQVWRV